MRVLTEEGSSSAGYDFDQSPSWKPEEIYMDDGRTLVLEFHVTIKQFSMKNRHQKESWQSGQESDAFCEQFSCSDFPFKIT